MGIDVVNGEIEKFDVLELLRDFQTMIIGDTEDTVDFIKNPNKIERPLNKLIRLYEKAKVDQDKVGNEEKDLNECLDWYEMHKWGRELWHELISAALYHIDPSSKGNSKIFEYLDAATEFEDLLYGLEPYYRDHTLHSLWVYLIGIKLMADRGKLYNISRNLNWYLFNDVEQGRDKDLHPNCLKEWTKFKKELFHIQLQKYKDSVWCVMALCHDLGYSLAKLEELNKKVEMVLKFFHVSDFRRVGYSLEVEHQYLASQFLELMAMDVRMVPGDYKTLREHIYDKHNVNEKIKNEEEFEIDFINRIKKPQEDLKEFLESKNIEYFDKFKLWEELEDKIGKDSEGLLDIAKDIEEETLVKCYRDDSTYWRLCKALERKEHGILSSYLIYKTLGIFADTSVRGPAEEWGIEDDEVILNIIRGDILFAIAQHEFAYAHIDQLGSLAEILILCDELEEFSRLGRQLQSRKYHDTTAKAGLNINQDGEKVKIEIEYIYQGESKDEFYGFVVRKAEKLCKLYSLNQRRDKEEALFYPIENIKVNFKMKVNDSRSENKPQEVIFGMNKIDSEGDGIELKDEKNRREEEIASQERVWGKIPKPIKDCPVELMKNYEAFENRMPKCKGAFQRADMFKMLDPNICRSDPYCDVVDICRLNRECKKCKGKSEECSEGNYALICHEDTIIVKTKCGKAEIDLRKWIGVKVD